MIPSQMLKGTLERIVDVPKELEEFSAHWQELNLAVNNLLNNEGGNHE